MGTTLTTLKTGHANFVTVVAIEGYPYLLTDGNAAAVATAWAGTDYADNTPLTGLLVELQNRQSINPWSGLSGGGDGNATITLLADATDRLGIDVARSNAGAETYLTSTLTRTTTTIPVYSTTGFPSSGEVWIGNECIEYTSVGAQQLNATVRGKYSPFGTESNHASNPRFAAQHRAGFVDYSVNIEPAVTQYRRWWNGAVVGIWLHRVSNPLLGTLDTRAEAQCIYAGVLDEPIDDPDRNATVIKCVPFAERIRSAVLFRDQWKAQVREGIWLDALSGSIMFQDNVGATTVGPTNGLEVVASGASGPNEINQGYYTPIELMDKINAWLVAERLAGRISGTYELDIVPAGTGWASHVHWKCSGTGTVNWGILLPGSIARLFGFQDPDSTALLNTPFLFSGNGPSDGNYYNETGDYAPLSVFVGSSTATQAKVRLYSTAGVALDLRDYMPPGWSNPFGFGSYTTVGMFQLGDGTIFSGSIEPISGGYELVIFIGNYGNDSEVLTKFRAPYSPSGPSTTLEVKQILALSGTAEEIVNGLVYSTGSSAYNDATWDTLGFGIGIGVPWGLLGADFEDSLAYSASGNAHLTVWISKPTRFQELIDQDLVLLGLYLVWKNGSFKFSEFSMPVVSSAVVALTEANKAEQVGDQASHRSPTRLTTEWAKQIVEIQWGYDFVEDKFTRAPYILEDRNAIDNSGQDIVRGTIKARNIDAANVPAAIDRLRDRLGFFTQPFHKIVRSISLAQYDLAPLEHVTVTDDSARDPSSGARRVTNRPALLLTIAADFGGPGRGLSGEVELWLAPVNRAAVYSPTAVMDETVNTGGFTRGYDSATKTIRTKSHEHTDSSADLDASYFAAGDKIYWCEIDPAVTSSPDVGTDTIVSVSTTDIVLTSGFSPGATKTYRIFSQAYTSAQATQQVNAYQADDADALIQDAAPPFRYELPLPAVGPIETTSARAELVPTVAYGDGKARDTGNERALIRCINQAIDYKTAHQSPTLARTVVSSGGTWFLAFMRPVYVGMQVPGLVTRTLSVAPQMRSSDGGTASIRITLAPSRPTGTSLQDILLPINSVSATFTTTSGTMTTPTAQGLLTSAVPLSGMAYLLVELSGNAECFGIAKCLESVRS